MSKQLIALVTGASQGIGAATARRFVEAGHRVILAARNRDKLTALAKELGPAATPIACDVADPGSVAQLFAQIGKSEPRLDVVFNNAGVGTAPNDVGDTSWEDWRRVVSVNLDGAFLIASAAFRLMKAQTPQGGRIINNGSISAYTPRVKAAAYTASKHAITGLTKSIALDGRAYNIACSQIDIGNCLSELSEIFARGVPQADGTIRPEPTMDVRHVADAVLHMAELPPGTNILFETIMATNMPYVGRG